MVRGVSADNYLRRLIGDQLAFEFQALQDLDDLMHAQLDSQHTLDVLGGDLDLPDRSGAADNCQLIPG